MEKDNIQEYVCKGRPGKELPTKTLMRIQIKNPNRPDRPQMLDVSVYDYIEVIGNCRYVAWKADSKFIYFKFFPTTNEHAYKLFRTTGKPGDPIKFNIYKQPDAGQVKPYCSTLKYPVYFNSRTDEYFIRFEDSKRKPLFNLKPKKRKGAN